MALSGNGYLAVTASSVRESAFTGFHAMFRLFKPPNIKNPNFTFKVVSDL
jgi:hypothetical protein